MLTDLNDQKSIALTSIRNITETKQGHESRLDTNNAGSCSLHTVVSNCRGLLEQPLRSYYGRPYWRSLSRTNYECASKSRRPSL